MAQCSYNHVYPSLFKCQIFLLKAVHTSIKVLKGPTEVQIKAKWGECLNYTVNFDQIKHALVSVIRQQCAPI